MSIITTALRRHGSLIISGVIAATVSTALHCVHVQVYHMPPNALVVQKALASDKVPLVATERTPSGRSQQSMHQVRSVEVDADVTRTMHTFYEPFKHRAPDPSNAAMLAEWERQWQAAGWQTRILSLKDAEAHPQYETLFRRVQNLPLGPNSRQSAQSREYNMLCYLRHIALAQVGGGWTSDYDTLPLHFSPPNALPNGGKMTSYQRHVPALMVGNRTEWERLVDAMISRASKDIGKTGNGMIFSDMLALAALNEDQKSMANTGFYYITREYGVANPTDVRSVTAHGLGDCQNGARKKAVHFSHAGCSAYEKKRGRKMSRMEVIQEVNKNRCEHSALQQQPQSSTKHLLSSTQHQSSQPALDLRAPGQPFMPRLTFTDPGVWANTSSVQLGLGPFTRSDETGEITGWSSTWQSGSAWHVKAGTENEFVISGASGAAGCGTAGIGVLVWFESIDNSVVFSAPALPVGRGPTGDLSVKFRASDPGEYKVHLVLHKAVTHEAGAHGTVARIQPITRSPWSLVAEHANWMQGSPTKFMRATEPCSSRVNGLYGGDGRWLQCAAANIPPHECLLDGWVYEPHSCTFSVWNGARIRGMAASIAAARNGRSVWIVITGSSIARGVLHAAVDLVAGIRMPGADTASVASALFDGVKEQRGVGSMTKCWGWYDVQIGSLRLSYQDTRLVYVGRYPSHAEENRKRWVQLLSESPDLIVVGDIPAQSMSLHHIVMAIQANPDFDGMVLLSPERPRFLAAGLKKSYSCSRTKPSLSIVARVRQLLDSEIQLCKADSACGTRINTSVAVEDALLMAWAFVFDMERPMHDKKASQHFHTVCIELLRT